MREMSDLEKYYNKFNEDKRLLSRHGQVEYATTMKYIHEYLEQMKSEKKLGNADIKILDIGAGTGRYSVALANEGYDVTAIELVKYNLGILKKKGSTVKAYQGNALKLKRFEDESFDFTLLFGPMYHLHGQEKQLQALNEAKRVTKKNGIIMVAYVMNDYSVITYAFVENHIKECIEQDLLDEDYKIRSNEEALYEQMRLEEIAELNEKAGLSRIKIIAPDGPADYIRPVLNAMDEETFEAFIRYQQSVCERMDLMGASSHTVDILRKNE